jgi:hypothetical protein
MGNTKIAHEITIHGKKARPGDRMTIGKGWRLAVIKGQKRVFVATLLGTHNLGNKRIAVFSVPKQPQTALSSNAAWYSGQLKIH